MTGFLETLGILFGTMFFIWFSFWINFYKLGNFILKMKLIFTFKNIKILKFKISKNLEKFYFKNNHIIDFILIFLIIGLLSYVLAKNFILNEKTNIQELIFSSIGIIAGILGVTFSIFILYIQSISSSYSGNIYFLLSKVKRPKIIFYSFTIIIIFNLFLFANYFNLNDRNIIFGMIFLFLFSIYLIWNIFNWSKKMGDNLYLFQTITKIIINLINKENKKISKTIKDNLEYEEVILLSIHKNVGDFLYNTITFLLDEYTSLLKNYKEKTADIIMNNIKIILINFLDIFKNNFFSYPNYNYLLGTNITFHDFFTETFLEIERRAEMNLKENNYKGLNTILNLYKDITLMSLDINIKGSNHFKNNLILDSCINSYIRVGKNIIKYKNTEGSFRWLNNSKDIFNKLLEKDNHINFDTLINSLNNFYNLDNLSNQTIIENYNIILEYFIKNNINYNIENYSIDNFLNNIKYLLVNLLYKEKEGLYIDYIDIKRDELFLYINEIFKRNIIEKDKIYFFINGIKKYLIEWNNILLILEKRNQGGIKYIDNLQIKVFCNFLLDLYCNNENYYDNIYIEIFEILSYKKLELNNIRSRNYIFEYITKTIIIGIKKSDKGFDFMKYYFEYYKKSLVKFEGTIIEKAVYENLVIICLVLYSKNFKYEELLKTLKNYEYNLQKNFLNNGGNFEKLNEDEIYKFIPIKEAIKKIERYLFNYNNGFNREYINFNKEKNNYNDNIIEWLSKNINLEKKEFLNFEKIFLKN